MNSIISWVGGKMLLRDDIIARFPGSFATYAEVYCGAAWVFFRKQRSKVEAINDMNGNLANLYWQVQENADALCERLRYAIDCEASFYHIRDTLKSGAPLGLYFSRYDDGGLMLYTDQEFAAAMGRSLKSYGGNGIPLESVHRIITDYCKQRDKKGAD